MRAALHLLPVKDHPVQPVTPQQLLLPRIDVGTQVVVLGVISAIRACAAVTMVIGLVALAGWVADVPPLKSVFAGAVEMKANTAVALIAAGLALWLPAERDFRIAKWSGELLALGVTVLGLATLGQYLFGWELRIDEFLFLDREGQYNLIRGRMSPYTALAFASIGPALLVLPRLRRAVWPAAGAAVPLLVGAISAIGYGWNASELTTDMVLPPVAINTAVAFVFLGIGTLLAIWRRVGLRRAGASVARLKLTAVENMILVGFCASFLLLVLGGGVSYKAAVGFAEAAKGVNHTEQVRTALSGIEASVSAAGLAQRNYLITGQEPHLAGYRSAMDKLGADLRGLTTLLIDRPGQLENLAALESGSQELRGALARGIRRHQGAGPAAAQVVREEAGASSSGPIFAILARMQAIEEQLLQGREATAVSYQRQMLGSMLLTLVAAACLFAFLFSGIRRQMQARHLVDQELIAARHEADAANRAKSAFLAAMSHEIRTPMNGVLGLLELLSLAPLDGEQQSTLSVVRESGRSLLRIVDDILDFSKIEANKLELHTQPASVAALISRISQIHSGAASSKGLLLHSRVDPGLSGTHVFDELRLEQILNNFVSNAIKFTDKGGVEVRVELAAGSASMEELRFVVADSGIGVSAENIGRLFEPFAQADAETSSRYGGTGLGLVICRRVAELMGGTVKMASELGVGTTMTLTVALPVAKGVALTERETVVARRSAQVLLESRRQPPTSLEAEREGTLLLLVDDHPTNRLVLKRQLNSLGYAAETAADGLQALQQCRSRRFGAILTDCNMPEMNGYELARTIRADEQASGRARVVILACTANALQSEAARCLEAGMDDYLVKPLQLSELSQRLDRWLPLPDGGAAAVAGHEVNVVAEAELVLDPAVLAGISGGGPDATSQLLAEFRKFNDEDAANLRRAAAVPDLQGVTQFSHRIGGSALMLGANALSHVCRDIETAGRASDPGQVRELLGRFEYELRRLYQHLDQHSLKRSLVDAVSAK